MFLTYKELVEIFKREIYEKPGIILEDKRSKYFECLNLMKDLKVSFQYYYEYEDLKQVLNAYINVLTEQLNPSKVHVFTPTKNDIRDPEYIYNTEGRGRVSNFGEVQLHTSMLKITDLFNDLDEEDERYGINFYIKNYTIENDFRMYNFSSTPFVGMICNETLLNYYLVKLHSTNYSNYRNSSKCKLFHLYDLNEGYRFNGQHLTVNPKYERDVQDYFKNNTNCFTLLPTYVPQHFLACLIHKTTTEINIYVIDSNHTGSNDIDWLVESLKQRFQQYQNITCYGHYMASLDYYLNFGGEDIFQTTGYCVLVGQLLMDIMYRNIVFHNKLRFDAKSSVVKQFINNVKEYCKQNFYRYDNTKWKIIVFNYSYRYMKSTGVYSTNPDRPLNGKYYQQLSFNKIKNDYRNGQNRYFTFKMILKEYFMFFIFQLLYL